MLSLTDNYGVGYITPVYDGVVQYNDQNMLMAMQYLNMMGYDPFMGNFHSNVYDTINMNFNPSFNINPKLTNHSADENEKTSDS
jgi:hypothetical protein